MTALASLTLQLPRGVKIHEFRGVSFVNSGSSASEDSMNARREPKYLLRVMLLASLLAAFLAASCSQQQVFTPTTIIVPARLNVATIDVAGVYDAVSRYAAESGLAPDPAQTDREKGTLASRRAPCAPSADERHSAWCIFNFTVSPAPDDPMQVAVLVRVRVPSRAEYDPSGAVRQIRIEPTLDRLVTVLRGRYGSAAVVQTDMLTF